MVQVHLTRLKGTNLSSRRTFVSVALYYSPGPRLSDIRRQLVHSPQAETVIFCTMEKDGHRAILLASMILTRSASNLAFDILNFVPS